MIAAILAITVSVSDTYFMLSSTFLEPGAPTAHLPDMVLPAFLAASAAAGALLFLMAVPLPAASVYDYSLKSIDGSPAPLDHYRGKVLLLVNVASQCGYTPQYTGLEKLHERFKDRGLVVLGFPANNFGGQEPGSDQEIKQFCSRKYNVSFPMYSKTSVKGTDINPLYAFLTDKAQNPETGGDIKWNFTKFLVNKDGKVIARFESKVTPDSPEVVEAIENALR
jgi:glutathione peroxidase